mgnify:CR=1 FL=1
MKYVSRLKLIISAAIIPYQSCFTMFDNKFNHLMSYLLKIDQYFQLMSTIIYTFTTTLLCDHTHVLYTSLLRAPSSRTDHYQF